jgi:hypothetical protein
LTLRASVDVLGIQNPEKGVTFGELFISNLTANDLDQLLGSLCAKFRTDQFYDKQSWSFDLAYQTFMIAKENGISQSKFRRLVRDFVASFKYTINHWQPDDILKLSEQPRLYPRSWVMRQMKDDPKVWEKLAMYEVGDHVLYAWKWEDVPLKRFVPRKARAESRGEDSGTRSQSGIGSWELENGAERSEEEPEVVRLVRENLKLKIKLDEMSKEKKELLREMAELERLVEELRRKNSEVAEIGIGSSECGMRSSECGMREE